MLPSYRWSVSIVSSWLLLWTVRAQGVNQTDVDNSVLKSQPENESQEFVCPLVSVTLPIFSVSCKTNKDCDFLGQLCCNVDGKMRCRKALLGFIPRSCPTNPITEVLPVKNCTNDTECWPRICCPDGRHSYCRTPVPEGEKPEGFAPVRNMIPYLQCTPPPPPIFDIFPKPCRNFIDCFPNLCCQERDKKFCRPARKSLLSLVVKLVQNMG